MLLFAPIHWLNSLITLTSHVRCRGFCGLGSALPGLFVSWLRCQAGPLSVYRKHTSLICVIQKEERKLPSLGARSQILQKGYCLPWVTCLELDRSLGEGMGPWSGQAWVSSFPWESRDEWWASSRRRGGFRTNWKKTSSLGKARVETWNASKSLQSVTLFWSQYSTGLYYWSFQLYFQCRRKMSHIITSTGHQS